jgi:phosphoribosylglycinamide formyltransferase 2
MGFSIQRIRFKTAKYRYATAEELQKGVEAVGMPCVVKPLVWKGQSTIKPKRISKSMELCRGRFPWRCGRSNCRSFVKFNSELRY